MTDQFQSLQEDIRFLRTLAEENRTPKLMGGWTLVAAGGLYGIASLAHWTLAAGLVRGVSPWAYAWIWGGATVLFMLIMAMLRRGLADQKTDAGARAAGLAWQAVGWTIFAIFACVQVVVWQAHSLVPLLLLPSLILCLYGLAWSVAAAVTHIRWVQVTAVGAFAAALAEAVVCQSPAVYALFAAALVLLAVVPGFAIVRGAGREG